MKSVLIIGLGLIGGSIARGLKNHSYNIYFIDNFLTPQDPEGKGYTSAYSFKDYLKSPKNISSVSILDIKIDIVD
jgi:phosphoglycerate dehydrogenase-like enzyme